MSVLILPLCLVQAEPYNKVKAPVIQLDMTRIFSKWNCLSMNSIVNDESFALSVRILAKIERIQNFKINEYIYTYTDTHMYTHIYSLRVCVFIYLCESCGGQWRG